MLTILFAHRAFPLRRVAGVTGGRSLSSLRGPGDHCRPEAEEHRWAGTPAFRF